MALQNERLRARGIIKSATANTVRTLQYRAIVMGDTEQTRGHRQKRCSKTSALQRWELHLKRLGDAPGAPEHDLFLVFLVGFLFFRREKISH
jgi:hypothetical protein